MELIRHFAEQLLASLSFLQEQSVIHCDLKPENILLAGPHSSALKLIDFGSSCFMHQQIYTYIQSRFYRAPEVILGLPYSSAIDMWSLACLIGELATGQPLFPGQNEKEQLARIIEVLGLPPKSMVDTSIRRHVFFEPDGRVKVVPIAGTEYTPGGKDLSRAVSSTEQHFLDFMARCLEWDPDKRLQPGEAARHTWILSRR
eukprot:jgi/Botrbrau1/10099/Bobra.20_2s0007.2